MADERARGLFVSIRPINGETKFSPTPPAPPPVGPALLCPYVMDSQASPLLGEPFDVYAFADGVLTATTTAQGFGQQGTAQSDYTRIASEPPPDESLWWSIAPGNGKVAFEGEVTEVASGSVEFFLQLVTGSPMVGDFAIARTTLRTSSAVYEVVGAGARSLFTGESSEEGTAVGARAAVVIDTDTGAVDLISSFGHENFAGVPVMDMTDGAGLLVQHQLVEEGSMTSKTYTKASDMQLPMPAGTTDSCLNPVSDVLTAYPLDASEAEAIAFGFDGAADRSLALQRGTYHVNGALGEDSRIAGPANGFTDPDTLIDFPAGESVAFEAELWINNATPSQTPDANAAVQAFANLVDGSLNGVLSAGVILRNDGQHEVLVGLQPTGFVYETGLLSGAQRVRVGFLVVGNSTLRLWVDGVEQTLVDDSITLPPVVATLQFTQSPLIAADLQASLTARLITDPYFFTTPFPPGSVDIAGKAV